MYVINNPPKKNNIYIYLYIEETDRQTHTHTSKYVIIIRWLFLVISDCCLSAAKKNRLGADEHI